MIRVIDNRKKEIERDKWVEIVVSELKSLGVRVSKNRSSIFDHDLTVFSHPRKKSKIHIFYNTETDGEIFQWANGNFILKLDNREKLEFYKKIFANSKANWDIEIR